MDSKLSGAISAQTAKETIIESVQSIENEIEEVALELWNYAEVGLVEFESAEFLKAKLQEHGFEITSDGTANVPTAFIAEYGEGEPLLGIMLEYDALPDLGNEVATSQQARKDGVTSGHGCGHNLIGSGALGSAIALKNIMEENNISGTIKVYGGAAEETEGAKVYMAREGCFKELDAMLHWHPSNNATVMNLRYIAMSQVYIEFLGKTAHAGVAPWEGRSALDAVEIFLHSVNMMREHILPTCRVHYIINDGGQAPNIVPDQASVLLTYRGENRSIVEEGVAWLKDMAKGAALSTQTDELIVDYYGMYDILPNQTFAERMQEHFEYVGLPEYTDEEIKFAKEIQTSAGVEASGMASEIDPVPDGTTVGGSSDIGDVSWLTPTMGVMIPTIPVDIGVHTWMATSCHGSSIGVKAAITAAKVMALTGYDVLTDQEFRESIRNDFEESTEGFTYVSPVNEIIKEPVGLPDEYRQFGTVVELKENFYKSAEDDNIQSK